MVKEHIRKAVIQHSIEKPSQSYQCLCVIRKRRVFIVVREYLIRPSCLQKPLHIANTIKKHKSIPFNKDNFMFSTRN